MVAAEATRSVDAGSTDKRPGTGKDSGELRQGWTQDGTSLHWHGMHDGCSRSPLVLFATGFSPRELRGTRDSDLSQLRRLAADEKCAATGPIGVGVLHVENVNRHFLLSTSFDRWLHRGSTLNRRY